MLYFEDKESDTFMVFFDIIFSEVVELRFLINILTVFSNMIVYTILSSYLGGQFTTIWPGKEHSASWIKKP